MEAVYQKLSAMEDEITELKEELNRSRSSVVKLEKKLKETQRKVDKINNIEKLCKEVNAKSNSLTKLQYVLNGVLLKIQKTHERDIQNQNGSQVDGIRVKAIPDQSAQTSKPNPVTSDNSKPDVPPKTSPHLFLQQQLLQQKQQQQQQKQQQQQQKQQQQQQQQKQQQEKQQRQPLPKPEKPMQDRQHPLFSQQPKNLRDQNSSSGAPRGQGQGVFHPGVQCDGCNGAVRGVRYKCRICDDYDLCSSCKGRDIHNFHPMEEIKQPRDPLRGMLNLGGILRQRAAMRLPSTNPFERLDPGERLLFDMLSNFQDSSDDDSDEKETKTKAEVKRGQLHPNVTCDGCRGPIHGIRYKCRTCDNFDLCSACEAKGVHGHHGMHMMDRPKRPF